MTSTGLPDTVAPVRRRLTCLGTVQGVGFRPAVHRLASSLQLGGWVYNSPAGVTLEIEGPVAEVEAFIERLPGAMPPLARLEKIDVVPVAPQGETIFDVKDSREGEEVRGSLPPDTALCPECRRDMESPADRRFHFPFTTCSSCGPRFAIVRQLPYDRRRTSMACFPFCPECEREYRDPGDRRFHAEPLSCPACGPRLWLADKGGGVLAEGGDALASAREALARGEIIAVKGLGGFQLACRADRGGPLTRLRERKRRASKPFAVMARDLPMARRLVELREVDADLLASPLAPILLAPRIAGAPVAPEAAPGLSDLGVMLPTTPLHVELFRGADYDTLVMTSGNASDEPICCGNREALARLAGIADAFLLHDRDIVRRLDDTVTRTDHGGSLVVRRSRGLIPRPLPLPARARHPVLALGAYLQATACLALGDQAIPSQHVGDLEEDAARGFLREAAAGLEELLRAQARVIAVDLHPDYASTWLGEELAAARGARLIRIQHHLAHAAAVWAEHGVFPQGAQSAGAIVLDGTGFGTDETAWGGEWLTLDGRLRARRVAHLEPFPLIGGERAVAEPWRVAVTLLVAAGAADLMERLPLARCVPAAEREAVAALAARAIQETGAREPGRQAAGASGQRTGWPRATGAGRLFEALGAILGLAACNHYEGEAAALLEAAASTAPATGAWREVALEHGTLPCAALLAAAARRTAAGEAPAAVARGFHDTFCRLAAELAVAAFGNGVTTIGLGGGCLVNRILRQGLAENLERAGFSVHLPREVPPGDGGLAYGQAVLAAVAEERGVEPEWS